MLTGLLDEDDVPADVLGPDLPSTSARAAAATAAPVVQAHAAIPVAAVAQEDKGTAKLCPFSMGLTTMNEVIYAYVEPRSTIFCAH